MYCVPNGGPPRRITTVKIKKDAATLPFQDVATGITWQPFSGLPFAMTYESQRINLRVPPVGRIIVPPPVQVQSALQLEILH
jgi:hypothetical protein